MPKQDLRKLIVTIKLLFYPEIKLLSQRLIKIKLKPKLITKEPLSIMNNMSLMLRKLVKV